MRYIVIGGSGFVGSYTIKELIKSMNEKTIENRKIICIDIVENEEIKKLKEVEFINIDIAKNFNFLFYESDVVVHLAARAYANCNGIRNLEKYFMEVNFFGTKNILEKMKEGNCKNLIYFSSDMVYGYPKYIPLDSNHSRNPLGEYGKSKKEAEDLIFEYRKKGINATIFRPRMIVGAGRLGILIKLFKLIDSNFPIPLIGNGNNCYQMISVNDCASAIIKACINKFPNKELNLGSNNPPSIKELLNNLIKCTKSKSFLIPINGRFIKFILQVLQIFKINLMYKEQYAIADKEYILDTKETKNILDWEPKYSDAAMMLSAYEEYKNNGDKNGICK